MKRLMCAIFSGLISAVVLAGDPEIRIPKGSETPREIALVIDEIPPPRIVGDQWIALPPSEMEPQNVLFSRNSKQETDWGVNTVKAPECWKKTRGKGVRVAVLDTGIDDSHLDLKDRVTAFKNFTTSMTHIGVQGHGTHVAGTIGATDNEYGTIGVAPEIDLLNGKILGDDGRGRTSWITAGVLWAIENKADVINMSVGGGANDPALRAAIAKAVDAGIIVVAAAGNSGPNPNTIEYPGQYGEVVCVGAHDTKNNIAEFSSRGNELDIVAPGVGIRAPYPGGLSVLLDGTSMATPHVAGVAALYVAHCRANSVKPSPRDFRHAMQQSAISRAEVRPNPNSGWGAIDAAGLLSHVAKDPNQKPGVKLTLDSLTPDARKQFETAFPGKSFTFEIR